jgi:hypothetical protein
MGACKAAVGVRQFYTCSAVPLIESLKSKAHWLIEVPQRKNLTHLQSVLLFKDSSDRKRTLAPSSVGITAAHYVENRKRGTTGLGALLSGKIVELPEARQA